MSTAGIHFFQPPLCPDGHCNARTRNGTTTQLGWTGVTSRRFRSISWNLGGQPIFIWQVSHDAAAVERLFAISPHLDDAVFACGEIVATAASATVVTVFA